MLRNMRSLLLATLAAISIPACTTDITGGGGGGGSGDQNTATCGNGVVDPGETCDDGNTVNGDGCSSTCQTEDTTTPRAVLNVDNTTIGGTASPVDLGVETDVTITATSMDGFTGDVTLTVTVTDANGAAITDWTTALDNATLTMTDGGTATAKLGISAMGDAAMLTGTVKVTATAGSMTSDVSVATTFAPEFRVDFGDDGTGACTYDPGHGNATPYQIKAGRTLRVFNENKTTALPFIVHSDLNGANNGFPHETQALPGTAPLDSYAGTGPLAIVGGQNLSTFYCHQGINGTRLEATGQTRPFFKIIP